MITPEQIIDIIDNHIIPVSKEYYMPHKGKIEPKSGVYPEYYEGYNAAVRNYHKAKLHAVLGVKPKELFQLRAPNQSNAEYEYMMSTFRQITTIAFQDLHTTVQGALHITNWDIKYQEEPQSRVNREEGFEQYLENLHTYGSYDNWAFNILPGLALLDAMAVVAYKPRFIPTQVNINEEGEEVEVLSENDMLEPLPYYYKSYQVLSNSNDYAIIELKERSIVKYSGKDKEIGRIFEIYDEQNIWRVVQVGDYVDHQFRIELYFQHDMGSTPVYRMGGVPSIVDNKVFYTSPFMFGIDNLDQILLDNSYLQAAKTKCVFPVRISIGRACNFRDQSGNVCRGGIINYQKLDGSLATKTCGNCNGSGLVTSISPTGEVLIDPEEAEKGDTLATYRYESPDTSSLEFLRDEIDKNFGRAYKIYHLNRTTDEAQGSEDVTATSKAIEQKSKYAFLRPIIENIFDHYELGLYAIGWMRYGTEFEQPNVIRPTNYDFTTEEDYLKQISEAIDNGAPPVVVRQVIHKYIKTVYFDDEKSSKVFKLIVMADRILHVSSEEIALGLGRGTIARWEDVLHTGSFTLINNLMMENENFLEQDIELQIEQLHQAAKDMALENAPATNVIDRIVGGITETNTGQA